MLCLERRHTVEDFLFIDDGPQRTGFGSLAAFLLSVIRRIKDLILRIDCVAKWPAPCNTKCYARISEPALTQRRKYGMRRNTS